MFKILPNLATCSLFESCTDEGWIIVDVRDLKDGAGNYVDDVAHRIELISNLMCSGYKVVVRCQAGMSRSNTFATAALVWCRIFPTWNDAWNYTKTCCPRAMLDQNLYATVKEACLKMCLPNKFFE
jgi:protein-tyrosine phosphatase